MHSGSGNRLRKGLALLSVNIVLLTLSLHGLELFLALSDPARGLPAHGKVGKRFYSWGHLYTENRYGYRERDFDVPKPPGVYRVMALGDSFTWGVGLDMSERYTERLEALLKQKHPSRRIEVLNFGVMGAPTVLERDILRFHRGIAPDRLIVGFMFNDTQPGEQGDSVERKAFRERHGPWLRAVQKRLGFAGLSRVGARLEATVYRLAEVRGVVPRWDAALQRTYEKDSAEYRDFERALGDIKALSDRMGLAPPVFAVLNHGPYTDRPTDFRNPDAAIAQQLRWSRQAEESARKAGFVTFNCEKEIAERFSGVILAVNRADPHPGADLHRLYAEKLFAVIEPDLAKQRAR